MQLKTWKEKFISHPTDFYRTLNMASIMALIGGLINMNWLSLALAMVDTQAIIVIWNCHELKIIGLHNDRRTMRLLTSLPPGIQVSRPKARSCIAHLLRILLVSEGFQHGATST